MFSDSTFMDDLLGVADTCVSLPHVLGTRGASRHLLPTMGEADTAALQHSAALLPNSVLGGLGVDRQRAGRLASGRAVSPLPRPSMRRFALLAWVLLGLAGGAGLLGFGLAVSARWVWTAAAGGMREDAATTLNEAC
jgi:hypothetical protein